MDYDLGIAGNETNFFFLIDACKGFIEVRFHFCYVVVKIGSHI